MLEGMENPLWNGRCTTPRLDLIEGLYLNARYMNAFVVLISVQGNFYKITT